MLSLIQYSEEWAWLATQIIWHTANTEIDPYKIYHYQCLGLSAQPTKSIFLYDSTSIFEIRCFRFRHDKRLFIAYVRAYSSHVRP